MIKPICDFCDEELVEFGGILFDPPRADGFARKRHVCVRCMERVDALAPDEQVGDGLARTCFSCEGTGRVTRPGDAYNAVCGRCAGTGIPSERTD